jgi:hypothetical protein
LVNVAAKARIVAETARAKSRGEDEATANPRGGQPVRALV